MNHRLFLIPLAVLASVACAHESSSPDDSAEPSAEFDAETPPTNDVIAEVASNPADGEGVDRRADEVAGPSALDPELDAPEPAAFHGKGDARIDRAQTKVLGKLDLDQVDRVVEAKLDEVRSCYNRGLVEDPDLGGQLELAFAIDITGEVSSAQTHGEFPTTVDTCLVDAASSWDFPTPESGSVEVTYIFELFPAS